MSRRTTVGKLAEAVIEQLNNYADLSSESMKKAVTNASKTVRNEIKATAPQDTGKYAKSWSTKNVAESASTLKITVYSRDRYQLAHLLEHGHAKRNGGRVSAKPHIAQAEEHGIKMMEQEFERGLKSG